MTRTLFTDDWTFYRSPDGEATDVRLPHDAMIAEPRSADGPTTGNHGGFFPGGSYIYRRTWTAPQDLSDGEHSLFFEGVYGRAVVLAAGEEIARNESPYREFSAPLPDVRPGQSVAIEVQVDNYAVPNSRWYTGSGIYRPVWLESHRKSRIARDGVHLITRSIEAGPMRTNAVVDAIVHFDGDIPAGSTLTVVLSHDGEIVARRETAVKENVESLELSVTGARLWSADRPQLYDLTAQLTIDDVVVDRRTERVGLRTIDVDPQHGLRINGEAVLLRGTAIHHDNGPLGAATFAAAEWRRARLLKEAGYNAIRSAHNPLSRAFLDACDRLGLYVMDELTDVWFKPKTPHDESPLFRAQWRDDAAALIAKDRNRPSVIMYSIGNEIAESATAGGVEVAREIHDFFRTSDPTRPTTIAVNPLLAMMAAKSAEHGEDGPPERRPATSTAANQMAAKMGRLMVLASTLPAAHRASRDIFETVDIAGYNYGYASYGRARKRYPDRVIVGTESMPGDLPAIWKRVRSIPGVIGDFGWTGWDYLGEVGLGYWSYGDEVGGIAKPYPGILAGCGVFDVTGTPGAALHLAQAVWEIAEDPGIAVRPMDRAGQRPNKTPWLASDGVSSWSWRGHEGVAEIEVYSPHDQVELLLNGRSLGRRAAGLRKHYVARFRARYEPGELTAVAYRAGTEVGRTTLRTAGPTALRLRAESTEIHGPDDLAYVWVELADADSIVDAGSEDDLVVTVTGAGELVALGSAAPTTTGTYTDDHTRTYRGRAIAIIRGSNSEGPVTIHARSVTHGEATLTLTTLSENLNDLPLAFAGTRKTHRRSQERFPL
ncbi:glycoside hydrolase family 2 TIM barrel-domain containing protein [Microbacterium sp. 2MCAF23]|uniref:glycoside hydrolase family 2 TIM barrel-domain containing protein n=1 Tax=Microbacterium sp. 2MCAF23 TaxID=3232985 RepID=UPI003F953422